MSVSGGVPDPQWNLALTIRTSLELRGAYVAEVDTRDAQEFVDLHWAARQAARLLGVKVQVDKSTHYGHADSIVTATVRCVEDDGAERARADEGLQRLLRSVRDAQPRTTVWPQPRTSQPADRRVMTSH